MDLKKDRINNKKKQIGLLGAVIDNDNMGCVALTYSILSLLEELEKESSSKFVYKIFEPSTSKQKITRACKKLNIDPNKIFDIKYIPFYSISDVLKNLSEIVKQSLELLSCDIIIDITQGDSFTDIYGQKRFIGWTNTKRLVEIFGKKLVLAPQTIGPFNDKKNELYAKKVIDNAYAVISRDDKSKEYVESISKRKVFVTSDLAFRLPYTKRTENNVFPKIKVGINISALLVADKKESTEVKFKLKTNYDEYIRKLVKYISENELYELHILPHVVQDSFVIKSFELDTHNVHICDAFSDPIEAKSYIASMDVFVGARMHATIGAFSSGIATIPVAYSRKFIGLFEKLKYNRIIDLQTMDTDEAFDTTIKFISEYKYLQQEVNSSAGIVEHYNMANKKIFTEILKRI